LRLSTDEEVKIIRPPTYEEKSGGEAGITNMKLWEHSGKAPLRNAGRTKDEGGGIYALITKD